MLLTVIIKAWLGLGQGMGMDWALENLLEHEDANFRRLARIWNECRTGAVPSRAELSLLKLMTVSAKIVFIDIAKIPPTIVYAGSDCQPFFYYDPLGVSLMQAFAYETYQDSLGVTPLLRDGQGVIMRLGREDGAGYELLVLPVADAKGRNSQAVVIGATASVEAKEGELKAIVSKHDSLSWLPVDLSAT